MHINAAIQVMHRTHHAALRRGERASALHLEGAPGIGKSDGTNEYCLRLSQSVGQPVGIVTMMLATITSPDVKGFMMPVKRENTLESIFSIPPWYPVASNIRVVEPDGTWHGYGQWQGPVPEIGVVFLDEWGQAEDEVKKPAAELLLHGNVGNTVLPLGWRVIAAGNRMADRSGVLRELMFIVNRRCTLSIDPHLPTWLEWASAQAPEHRPHYLTMSFAQKNPDIVFKEAVPKETGPFCTPRTLCLLDKDLKALRSDEQERRDEVPTDNLAREVARGWIGEGEAAQFFTHLKYADELPDMADIEKNPERAKLPKNMDAQMVCGYMLAHNVTDANADNVQAYINRMNVEMQVLAVRTMSASPDKARIVMNRASFGAWLAKHKDLIVASRS